MGYLAQAGAFLIDVIFGIAIFILMLRFLIQWTNVGFNHPLTQFLYQATNPVLQPLQRVIPRWGRVDLACLLLMLALKIVAIMLLGLFLGQNYGVIGLVIVAFAELFSTLIYVLMFSIIIQVILNWINPDPLNPVYSFVSRLNDPLTLPLRRRLPLFHGIDFSPLVAIILLQLALILIVAPLTHVGQSL